MIINYYIKCIYIWSIKLLDSHKPALTNTLYQTIHFESSELYNTQNMYTNVHVHLSVTLRCYALLYYLFQ